MSDPVTRLSTVLADRYRVERELGRGGMAMVYLAQDLKHERKVALKVLRPELAAAIGPDRFLQEIKVTANLQHPHILGLIDSGQADGAVYYVMPYVDGETLRSRLTRETQLPVDEAIRLTREIASALDYAHRHNVIHRDIKPENILLHDGQVLVADFGIALAASAAGGTRMTETGMSLGTPQYMSPEQAMGERGVGPRSDVYALGCVLFEMLSGEPPFTGPSAQAVVAKVMTEDPRRLTQIRRTVPQTVEDAVLTALEKLPADRFGTPGEFAAALEGGSGSTRIRAAYPATRRNRLVYAALAVVSVAALWGWLRPPVHERAPVLRFVVGLPPSEQLYEAPIPHLTAAPDGSGFAYVGMGPMGRRLILRRFGSFTSSPLTGSEDAEQPFFSPDGQWIGFRANSRMWKLPTTGGQPRLILDQSYAGATWQDDGNIVFGDTRTQGLSIVSANGGSVKTLTKPDSTAGDRDHILPRALPGSRALLFVIRTAASSRLAALNLSDSAVTVLGEGSLPTYAPPGHLAYLAADGPRVVGFDSRTLRITGTPTAVELDASPASEPVSELDVSRNGTLIYLTRDARRRTLVEVDKKGRERVLSDEPRGYDSPRYSPDGRRVAVRIQSQGFDNWIFDFARGTSLRLTFNQASFYPEWTPDGSRIVYPSTSRGETGLYWKLASGAGDAEAIYDPPQAQWESSWSRDGREAVVRMNDSITGRDLWLLRMPERSAAALLATPASELAPKVSPDGKFLAYVSNATGRAEVYVRTLPDSGGTWLVSDGGGTEPLWAPDGRTLYYRNGDAIMGVAVETRPSFTIGKRDSLFAGSYVPNPTHTNYDVDPSGDHFLMVRMAEGERRAVVVFNWNQELAGTAQQQH